MTSLKFTTSEYTSWLDVDGSGNEYYHDGDSAHCRDVDDNEDSCMYAIVESASSETLKFHWKVSSEEYGDYLEFYIDGTLKDSISGEVDWTQKTYNISSGIHSLKWRYVKDSSGYAGEDEAWVDFVQWTGASPVPDSDNWKQLDFKYDVYGRRSEKLVDGYGTRYLGACGEQRRIQRLSGDSRIRRQQ